MAKSVQAKPGKAGYVKIRIIINYNCIVAMYVNMYVAKKDCRCLVHVHITKAKYIACKFFEHVSRFDH